MAITRLADCQGRGPMHRRGGILQSADIVGVEGMPQPPDRATPGCQRNPGHGFADRGYRERGSTSTEPINEAQHIDRIRDPNSTSAWRLLEPLRLSEPVGPPSRRLLRKAPGAAGREVPVGDAPPGPELWYPGHRAPHPRNGRNPGLENPGTSTPIDRRVPSRTPAVQTHHHRPNSPKHPLRMKHQTKTPEPDVAPTVTALASSQPTTIARLAEARATAASKLRLGCPLTVKETAAFCGFHPESVRRAIRRRRLKATTANCRRGWLITRATLAAYLGVPESELVALRESPPAHMPITSNPQTITR